MKPIKIDKNISIPIRIRQKSKKWYPTFENMKIGDSFAISIGDENPSKARNRLYMAARNFKFYKGVSWVFISRVIDNEVRIWRVS